MASLYISYFGSVVDEIASGAISSEAVTTSASNAQSGTVPAGARALKFNSDTAHYIKIDTNPDATVAAGRVYVAANEVFWLHFPLVSGTYKVAAITA